MALKKLFVNGSLQILKVAWRKEILHITCFDQHGDEREYVARDVVMNKATNTLCFTLGSRSYQAIIFKVGARPEPVEGYERTLTAPSNQPMGSFKVIFPHTAIPYSVSSDISTENVDPKVHRAQSLIIKSPLAGRVTSMLVLVGQQVGSGTPLMTIESMKMENEITATRTGVVKTISIKVGDVIQPNQTLIEFENEGELYATSPTSFEQKIIENT